VGITRNTQALRKMTPAMLLKREKNNGIAVYIPKETSLKEMTAKIEEVKPLNFLA
jgi:hypothetical protein